MKCLVLAGGRGDRLWPLSRKNYPKQFISIQKDHSIFQETIARNIPFCDEFIIVTNKEYQFIVENQMKAFQGITYRLVLEEVGRKTTAAIVLSCLQFPFSELMFVVASDHLIDGPTYKDDVTRLRSWQRKGGLSPSGWISASRRPVSDISAVRVRMWCPSLKSRMRRQRPLIFRQGII